MSSSWIRHDLAQLPDDDHAVDPPRQDQDDLQSSLEEGRRALRGSPQRVVRARVEGTSKSSFDDDAVLGDGPLPMTRELSVEHAHADVGCGSDRSRAYRLGPHLRTEKRVSHDGAVSRTVVLPAIRARCPSPSAFPPTPSTWRGSPMTPWSGRSRTSTASVRAWWPRSSRPASSTSTKRGSHHPGQRSSASATTSNGAPTAPGSCPC